MTAPWTTEVGTRVTWRFNKQPVGTQHFGTVTGHPEGGGVTVTWDHPHPVFGGPNVTTFRCGEVREVRRHEEEWNAQQRAQARAAA